MPAMSMICETDVSLGQEVFGEVELGDARRTARMVRAFDRICRHPDGTLPQKLASPADLRAFYRLANCRHVTHKVLIAAARGHTLRKIESRDGAVLLIHDATELDYTGLTSVSDDLGQIGRGSRRGYICQNVLAVTEGGEQVFGLVDQILHHRDEVPERETKEEHRDRESRESRLWILGTTHLPANRKFIDVADQGSDTFEFLEHECRSGRRFVIRACKQRKCQAGHDPSGLRHDLKEYSSNLPELGRFTMDVQAQPGRQARKETEFVVRGGPVLICPPHCKAGHHGDDPLPLYVVRVTEVNPPPGQKTIEWMLLTNEPVKSFDDAWRVTGWYEHRWIVEELHKSMKTGCQIEDLQFTTLEALEPAIALLSVVAVTLLNLREASRRLDAKLRLATTLLAPEYVEALSVWRHQTISRDLTIHDFFYALARLGGHQNRKSDHRPGWIVIWRGWTKLQCMTEGYVAAQRKKCGRS
jgi:hypothetical protein